MQMTKTWQAKKAQCHFGEVIRQTAIAPQSITRHGKPVAVIVSIEKYRQLTKSKKSLSEALASAPVSLDCLEM